MINLNRVWKRLEQNPRFKEAGMVLFHVGIVRCFSREGKKVQGIIIDVDHKLLAEIIGEARQRPGIVAVEIEIAEGYKKVGDPLMILAVAGDFRENVIQTLSDTLNRIKAHVTRKREIFAEA